jgi:transposase
VTKTMTWVGLEVHARSTHAAAIDVASGELLRARFEAGSERVVAWLQALPQPVHACYEAGPTGFALYRACAAAGLRTDVVAPSKTPRAPGDRINHDRKDAELLCRLLLAGQLRPVAVPAPAVEAARHLCRAREQVRQDLMRARHRVSKLLLLHGRVYPEPSTWTLRHRRWLSAQRFEEAASELAYLDALGAVDGLVARKAALDERLSRLALEPAWWPTVARLRSFRGIDTLSAFVLCLEVGDWSRFRRPAKLASWLGLVPALDQSGESSVQGRITKTGSSYARRLLVEAAWHYLREPRIGATLANRQAGQPAHVLQIAWRAQPPLPTPAPPPRPRQAAQRGHGRGRARARLLPLGRCPWRPRPSRAAPARAGAGPDAAGTRDGTTGSLLRPRPLLDSASPATQAGQWGSQSPHRQTDCSDVVAAPGARSSSSSPVTDWAMRPGPLTTRPPYQFLSVLSTRPERFGLLVSVAS